MRIVGVEIVGVMGEVPVIEVPGKKPELRNQGDNSYSGQASAIVAGLGDMLYRQTPEAWRDRIPERCGHVRLRYTEGGEFLAWAGSRDGVFFGFS